LVHPFEKIFEVIEPALPKPRHPICPINERGERLGLCAIERLTALLAIAYELRLFENAEMLGDSRLRDSGPLGQSANRLLTFTAQPLKYRPPCRIRERTEDDVWSVPHRDQ
jgi:hypothetical protein